MSPATWIREQLLSLELMFICHAAFLKRVPGLRRLHRNVTADLTVLEPPAGVAVAFTVAFRSPYLHLPVAVEMGQIGEADSDHRLQPTSFRFFDWQTWGHIAGSVEWRGERRVLVEGRDTVFITGFRYRVSELPALVGNLGLRLAEGVEATVRVACGHRVARVPFDPVFWLLEATDPGFRPVPIQSNELMGLIVPLFDLGRGDPRLLKSAVERLQRWAELNLSDRKPFQPVFSLLRYIQRWGPLGMEPMFRGVGLALERLQVREPERHLFEYFADHWGIRGSRNGRLLAVRLLEALATERARAALQAILELVRHQGIAPDELDLIRQAVDTAEAKGRLARQGRAGEKTEQPADNA